MANCKDCNEPVFSDKRMVILNDDLWKNISDNTSDIYCDKCIEQRMGRSIAEQDLYISELGQVPCNMSWAYHNNKSIYNSIVNESNKNLVSDLKDILNSSDDLM